MKAEQIRSNILHRVLGLPPVCANYCAGTGRDDCINCGHSPESHGTTLRCNGELVGFVRGPVEFIPDEELSE